VAVLLAFTFLAGIVQAYQTQNVFIMVIDGARYTETFGDTSHQYIPQMWNRLRPLGTIYTRFYNDSVTVTNPGHSAIITGAWQNILNDGTERPHTPTIFEYFRKEDASPATENYVILGKDKLDILAYGDYAGYGAAYGASVKTSTAPYGDITTFNNIKSVVTAAHPRLSIINFARVDSAGHSGTWATYCTAIRLVDSLANELWNLIQNDATYKDKTTLIVVNDHGRHTSNFASHGDGCDGCRHIMCMVLGPDTRAGVVDSVRRTQVDIAPTIGTLLGFATPYSIGTAITSAYPGWREERPGVPKSFGLWRASFDPGSRVVTVNYGIPARDLVTLKVFNLLGGTVATLLNAPVTSGAHQVTWNTGHLAGGIYVCRLQTGEYDTARKLALRR
jgi:hypothetical protein